MLNTLRIKNIAIIKDLTIDFSSGLNVMSGETGAGKSIILDALGLLLGEKSDKALIRYGEDMALAEGVFDVQNNDIKAILEDNGIDFDSELIILRKIYSSGKNETRINGCAVTLQTLKLVGSFLCDIHGQHEHQSLLKVATHIDILDKYAAVELSSTLETYKQKLKEYKNIKKKQSVFGNDDERIRKLDSLRYQIDEIENADLYEGEDEELLKTREKLQNSAKILENLSSAYNCLDVDDGTDACTLVADSKSMLNNISSYDDAYANLANRLDSTLIELRDIADTIKSELDDADYDSNEADRVENRYNEIKLLKKKYGDSINAILAYKSSLTEEYNLLNNSEEEIASLENDRIAIFEDLTRLSSDISACRQKYATKLERSIMQHLSDLGMSGTSVKVNVENANIVSDSTFLDNGVDKVEFLISPNKGEPLRPLAKIISGGEMSRFMLAIKCITSKLDGISTLIFDEIDTGISGNIAEAVAEKMAVVSKETQIIAVTHLPHIACMADNNFFISKRETTDATFTSVEEIDGEDKIAEISRLCGGVSDAGKLHAKDLISKAEQYKKSIC